MLQYNLKYINWFFTISYTAHTHTYTHTHTQIYDDNNNKNNNQTTQPLNSDIQDQETYHVVQ